MWEAAGLVASVVAVVMAGVVGVAGVAMEKEGREEEATEAVAVAVEAHSWAWPEGSSAVEEPGRVNLAAVAVKEVGSTAVTTVEVE